MAEKSANGSTQDAKRRPAANAAKKPATKGAGAKSASRRQGARPQSARPQGTGPQGANAPGAKAQSTGAMRRQGTGRQSTGTARRIAQASNQPKRTVKSDVNANFKGAGVQTRKQVKQKAKQQKEAPARHARAKSRINPILVGGIVGGLLLVIVITGVVIAFTRGGTNGSEGTSGEGQQTSADGTPRGAASVSFCAVGSNVANADILSSADAWAGATGDGAYDFSPLYEQMKGTIGSYDIAFVSQGSSLGGNTNFEYQGYPSYNTPDSMADALEGVGFDVVNTNTNHTYDMWVSAVEHSQSVWAQHPNVMTIGSYTSESDRSDIRVVEKNGMSVAFLSYSYGQNGYKQSDLPNDYYAAAFNKEKMREEVERAHELADAVVVFMQWNEQDEITGSTDPSVLSDQQQDYASYLAGLGVDLLIGCRGQSIEPVRYVGRGIRTTDGSGVTPANGMLCVYSLGDFVSAYTLPSAVLSGMLTCDFVRDDNGEVSVENPVWHALIEHRSGGADYVCPLSDYTSELASSNELLARLKQDGTATGDPLQWARDTTVKTVGDAIEVVT
ncbi:MAG: CapA family protein [Atopobiaceae bacterium]|nr:CapA family protein [Atopobiaceae bacterium]